MAIREVKWVEIWEVLYHEGTKGIPACALTMADVEDAAGQFDIAIPIQNIPRLCKAMMACYEKNKDKPALGLDYERPLKQIVRPEFLGGHRLRMPGGPILLGVDGHDGFDRRTTGKGTFSFPAGTFSVKRKKNK